jgi:hypothetical protein
MFCHREKSLRSPPDVLSGPFPADEMIVYYQKDIFDEEIVVSIIRIRTRGDRRRHRVCGVDRHPRRTQSRATIPFCLFVDDYDERNKQ